MNKQATQHLSQAASFVAKGEDFYRKAAEEIVAAQKADPALSNRQIGAYIGEIVRGEAYVESWVREVVSWRTSSRAPASPFARTEGESERRDRSATKKVLREASPTVIAEQLLSDPTIRAKVSQAQAHVYDQQAETLKANKHEREVERKGGEQEHAEFTRRQRVSEVVNVARGAASGLRFVAGQVKSLNLAEEDSGVAEELVSILADIDGFVSMVRSYLGGETVTDEDIAALIGGGDE